MNPAVCIAACLIPFVLHGTAQSPDPILGDFRFRSIGPAAMSGRVDDIVAVERDPATFYAGFATGGVWKTVNAGTTWTPIFDTYGSASIGDLAISQKNPDLVWVGTGEANNRQSSSFGDGIYKSTDGGRTFRHMGLRDTQTIARIVIDPRDDNVVYVAAPGHLFGPNPDGAVYKTVNGGDTWSKVKFVDEHTGFTDLVLDTQNPDTILAASHQRRRTAWGYNGGGPGSGIWRSPDAGVTWTKLEGSGLPDPSLGIGRIGLAVSRSKPGVVMGIVEVGRYSVFGSMMMDDGSEVPPGLTRRPRAPFPPLAPGQSPDPSKWGIWRSEDSGRTWRIISNHNDRPAYYSKIWIDPTDDQVVYTGGAPLYRSTDGGRVFIQIRGLAHSDHHALWINPANARHLIDGNDGGVEVSYDRGATWEHLNLMAVTQFYAISADMRAPYYVCGGAQDNSVWCGPSAVRTSAGIANEDWYRLENGDGFYTQNDPVDWATVYSGTPFGAVTRTDLRTGRTVNVRPRPTPPQGWAPGERPAQPAPGSRVALGEAGLSLLDSDPPNVLPPTPPSEQARFNWVTPFLLSPHDSKTLYVGGERLYISRDRGDTYSRTIDLTRQIVRTTRAIMGVPNSEPMVSKAEGAPAFSTITSISESPVQRGVLWVGTDDGLVQVSRDGGKTWTNVSARLPGAPAEAEVSRVEASPLDAGTCYVSLDNHWNDDLKPYVYVTTDFGATFRSIAANLPAGNVNVVRAGRKNRRLLFAGTEFGLFVSLDGGGAWMRFMNGLPTVRVDDLLIHPRDGDLIVGTHGRSIWILDDISPLESLPAAAAEVHLFEPRPARLWLDDVTLDRQASGGMKSFRGQNPQPGTAISYVLAAPVAGDVRVAVADAQGTSVREMNGTNKAGLNRVRFDPRATPPAGRGARPVPAVAPGTYTVTLSAGGRAYTTKVVVEADRLGR